MKTLLPKIIAITGGSGAGKSWLAGRLQKLFPGETLTISLDNYYRDRSSLPLSRRQRINFDHPRALDWPLLERALRACRSGHPFRVPIYDFATHSRLACEQTCTAKPLVLVEGLWLLRRPTLRRLFDLSIYIDCPAAVRLQRRLQRDTMERQRSVASIKQQFRATVAPMHQRFITPQSRQADLVVAHPLGERQVQEIANIISALMRTCANILLHPPATRRTSLSTQLFQP